jgi:hypothetical protein
MKVELYLEESIRATEIFKPELLALNPNGKVPVIYDNDAQASIFDITAILLYLAEKKSFCRLRPTTPVCVEKCCLGCYLSRRRRTFLRTGREFPYVNQPDRYSLNRYVVAAGEPPPPAVVVGVVEPQITVALQFHGHFAPLFAVFQKFGKLIEASGLRSGGDVGDEQDAWIAKTFDQVGHDAVLRRAQAIDDLPEGLRLFWRRLGVESVQIEIAEMLGDRRCAAGL